MKRSTILSAVSVASLVFGVCACDYEWKDEPARQEEQGAQEPPREEPKPQQVERPVLAPGKDVSGAMTLPDKAKKLNLTEMAEGGSLKASAVGQGMGDVSRVYDEVDTSLARTNGTNPFKASFEFSEERSIRAIRVLSTYSDYGVAIQFGNGERFVVDVVVDGDWATVAWPNGMKTKTVTVEVLRKVRDNYVHVNEVEIYE